MHLLYEVIDLSMFFFFFFQAEDGIRDHCVTGVQTCALPILCRFEAGILCGRASVSLRALHPDHAHLLARYLQEFRQDRKSTRLNSSHTVISYAVFCLKKKKKNKNTSSY